MPLPTLTDRFGRTITKETIGLGDFYTINQDGFHAVLSFPTGTDEARAVDSFNNMAPANYQPPEDQDMDIDTVCACIIDVNSPMSTPTLTIPDDHEYRVGTNRLEVHLNGQALVKDKDYTEVGDAGSYSKQFTLTWNLIAGDCVTVRIR